MEANNNAIRKALTALVNYLKKEVKRTSKCKRCRYRGKSFRGEPCYWHVDCGIDDSDYEASDNAMYLLKRFKLQEALSDPPRNCDALSKAEVLEVLDDCSFSKEDTIDWLYDEKGESYEQK